MALKGFQFMNKANLAKYVPPAEMDFNYLVL